MSSVMEDQQRHSKLKLRKTADLHAAAPSAPRSSITQNDTLEALDGPMVPEPTPVVNAAAPEAASAAARIQIQAQPIMLPVVAVALPMAPPPAPQQPAPAPAPAALPAAHEPQQPQPQPQPQRPAVNPAGAPTVQISEQTLLDDSPSVGGARGRKRGTVWVSYKPLSCYAAPACRSRSQMLLVAVLVLMLLV